MAKHYFGNLNVINKEIPKRPLMFPFFSSLVHSVIGFKSWAPFVVNFICLTSLLFAAIYYFWLKGGLFIGLGSAFLILSHPVVPMFATSAGFDLASAVFFILSLFAFSSFVKHDRYGTLFISTLAVFAHIRYESILIAMILIGFAFFKKKRLPKMVELFQGALFGFFMLPHFWQRILSQGKYENPQGVEVFSFSNFTDHLYQFATGFIDFSGFLPYNTIVLWLGLVCASYQVYLRFRGQLKDHYLVYGLCILAGVVVYLSHHAGVFTHPAQVRFFIPLTIFLSVSCALTFLQFKMRFKPMVYPLCCMGLLAFYHPVASENRFLNTLTINRDLSWVYQVASNYTPSEVLFVYDRPGQLVAKGYGAVNFSYAKDNWKALTSDLDRGLYQRIIFIEKLPYKKSDKRGLASSNEFSGEVKVLKKAQSTATHYLQFTQFRALPHSEN
jgi:hypothetical protein